jgi:hypothetical protein
MFHRDPFPVKKVFLWFTVFLLGLIVVVIIFASIVSIKIGLSHTDQEGFFVPILAGAICIALSLFLLIYYIKLIVKVVREKDIIRSS